MQKNTRKTVHSSLSSWGEGALGLGEVLQLRANLSCVSFKHPFSQRWEVVPVSCKGMCGVGRVRPSCCAPGTSKVGVICASQISVAIRLLTFLFSPLLGCSFFTFSSLCFDCQPLGWVMSHLHLHQSSREVTWMSAIC